MEMFLPFSKTIDRIIVLLAFLTPVELQRCSCPPARKNPFLVFAIRSKLNFLLAQGRSFCRANCVTVAEPTFFGDRHVGFCFKFHGKRDETISLASGVYTQKKIEPRSHQIAGE